MLILCGCGCGEEFERTSNRMTVKPEHRHEYRKKMELERWHKNKGKYNEARRKNNPPPEKPGTVMCNVKCPTDGEIYKMAFNTPPAVMPRIYCHKHLHHRDAVAGNEIFVTW